MADGIISTEQLIIELENERRKNQQLLSELKDTKNLNSEYFTTVINSIGDAVITTDIHQNITNLNPVAVQLTGWSMEDALGKPLLEVFNIISEETRQIVENPFDLVLEKGIVVGLANHTLLIDKTGKEFPIADSGAPIFNSKGVIEGIVIVFRDQSEERYHQRILETRLYLMEYAEKHSYNEVMCMTLDKLQILTQSQIGCFHFVDMDNESILLQTYSAQSKKQQCKAHGLKNEIRFVEAGIWADAIKLGKSIIHNSLNEMSNNLLPECQNHLLRELIAPVHKNGKIVALLVFGNKPNDYNQYDIDVVNFLADTCWEIIDKKRISEELLNSNLTLLERVKELNCLNKISNLFFESRSDLNVIMQEVVDSLPPAFLNPSKTYAKIKYNGIEYKTNNFAESEVVLREKLFLNSNEIAIICVHLDNSEGVLSFLPEELVLFKNIANQLSKFLEKKFYERQIAYDKLLIDQMGEVAKIGGWEFDIETGEGTWTAETARIHGVSATDKTNMQLGLSFYTEESKEKVSRAINEAINTGKQYELELELIAANGEKKWVRTIGKPVFENGKIVKVRGSFQDITEVVYQREYIANTAENLNITLNSIGDAVIVVNSQSQVVRMNPVAEKLTGYSHDEVLGKSLDSIFRIFNAQTGEKALNPVNRVLKEGIVVGLANHTKLVDKDGVEYQISDSAAPIKNSKGKVEGVVLVFRDVTEDYRIQEELVKSELHYRTVFENTGSATCLIEHDGLISLANSTFSDLAGLPLSQIQNQKYWMDFVVKEDLDMMLKQHQLRRSNNEEAKNQYEFRFIKSNGDIRYIQLFVDVIPNSLKSVASLIDITERKQQELKIMEGEKQLRRSFMIGQLGSWKMDLKSRKMNISEESATIYGIDFMDEYSFKDIQKIHLPESGNFLDAKILSLIKSGSKYDVEYKIKRPSDGKYVDIRAIAEYDSQNHSIVGIIQDITEKKKIENQLVESEKKFRSFVENANDLIYSVNLEGVFTYMSPNWLDLIGESGENVLGKSIADYVHPEDVELCRDFLMEVITTKQKQSGVQYRVKHTNGNYRWHVSNGSPQLDENGNVIGYFGIARDVTEQKMANEALALSENKFRNLVAKMQMGLALHEMIFDENGKPIDYLFLDVNPAFERITGLNANDILGKTVLEVLPQTEQYWIDTYGEVVRSGKSVSYENFSNVLNRHYSVVAYKQNSNQFAVIIDDISSKKLAEKELKYSLQRIKALLEANPDMMFVFDKDCKIVDYSSPALNENLYAEPESFMYKNITEVMPPHVAELTIKHVKQVLDTGKSTFETYYLDQNGVRNFFEVRFSKSSATEVLAIVRNISESVEVGLALKNSEEKFRNLFLKHSAIKFIIDAENASIIDANESAAEFYGWSIDELKGMKISQINTLPLKGFKDAFSKATSLQNNHFDFQHRKADGSIADVEVFASKIEIDGRFYIHSIVHDVTEKKKNEYRLKLLSRSVEQNPVTIVITDFQGNIEYVNPAFTKIAGYTLEEAIGNNPRVLKSGYHTKEFYKNMWETILAGNDWMGELLNRSKNGNLYWENVIISPIVNEVNEITHFIAVKEDISGQKKMIEDLTIEKERALEADKLKSAFLANMSHEIRTPMNGILGFTGLLRAPDLSEEEKEQFIDIIQKSGQRMLNTVNDLIDISKIETGQMPVVLSAFNVNEVVRSHFEFFRLEASSKNIELILNNQIHDSEKIIVSDPGKFDSIIINLVKNAIKYTDSGEIELGCKRNGAELIFYVKDTGIGIPSERLTAIFNRFEQADIADKRAFQGSGLGLAITKAYVEMLGGHINVESKQGVGSVFSFTILDQSINFKSQNVENEIGEETDFIVPLKRKLRILIAEDDDTGFYYMSSMLKKVDCEIVRAINGVEVVRIFSEDSKFDLILMDIKMAEMDGYEAAARIRKINKNVIIIAQTAYALAGDKEKAIKAGCNDYLAKPILKNEFFEVLNKYINLEMKL